MPLKQRYRKLVPKLYRNHSLTNEYNIFKLNNQKFFDKNEIYNIQASQNKSFTSSKQG